MGRLRGLWLRLQASLWFRPTLIVLACAVLALAMIEVQPVVDVDFARRWPRLFGAGVDGAREMLSAIATSVITVTGVLFSVTIVALSQASSQYSPRVLRAFMADHPTQHVLGAFVGIYVYCLMVLRTISSDENGGFLPSLAVLGGLLLALAGVGMLIYFVHHVASSIQATAIVERIAGDTATAIDHLFPQPIGEPAMPSNAVPRGLDARWRVDAPRSGYLVRVDDDRLMERALRLDRTLVLAQPVGGYVVEGQPLLHATGEQDLDAAARRALGRCVEIDRQRSVHQDAAYGVQQIVDVAVKALSPGINDPTTAVECIDALSALLVRLAGRATPSPYRAGPDGRLRVVAHGPDFSDLLALSLDAIGEHARGDAQVQQRLLVALRRVGEAVNGDRAAAWQQQVQRWRSRIERGELPEDTRARLLGEANRPTPGLRPRPP